MVAAFAFVFMLARQLVGAVGALVAVLIIDGLHYFTFTAPKFNHDVVQLPFWALAGYAYWAALRRGRLVHWLLLGFAIGMALWSKYFVVVLAAPLALFALFDRDARKAFATPGPYVRRGRRADRDGAASPLARRQRFPAIRLCRCPRAAFQGAARLSDQAAASSCCRSSASWFRRC